MKNEKRIINYVRSQLAEITTAVGCLDKLSHLDFELSVLEKLLDRLPCYAEDDAIAAICGNEEEPNDA